MLQERVSIEYMNTRNYWVLLIVVLIAGSGVYAFWKDREQVPAQNTPVPAVGIVDPLNATYLIDGVSVSLVNGRAETPSGSAKMSTAVFGQPIIGDLNGDRINDAALFMTQDMGGSGVFYYVAASIHSATGTRGTNASLLGDRIAPQSLEVNNRRIIANYADRKPGEPMTTSPSVGISASYTVEGVSLQKVAVPVTTLTYLSSTAKATDYCNGADMDSAGYKKTITVENTTSTLVTNPTQLQLVKETIRAATVGMCRTVLDQAQIKIENSVVTIPPLDGWAGSSITLCSCKPMVETNVLRIPGMTKVVWE